MSTENLLAQRGGTHGDFTDNAGVTDQIMEVLHESRNWKHLGSTKRTALFMIVHKIGRIVSGNPEHADHWQDIQGYAKLAEERLPKLTPKALK